MVALIILISLPLLLFGLLGLTSLGASGDQFITLADGIQTRVRRRGGSDVGWVGGGDAGANCDS
ncbi:hypothetical protein JMJ56_27550 [Belnapia sp. T18]|uniref:Uncharacterized protein n=1 Tax=Belnapia arida TaxID=2804533 RepID=A0ABS1UDJ6_9PROT|nr:hypothetical protein [Belnapia arida]MBL6081742.1 hypothetical protein [Belnapia arida]